MSHQTLLERARGALRDLTPVPPHAAFWAPGRIEIFGKHTDYAGGRSLLAALPRGIVVAATPRLDSVVRIVSADSGEATEIDPRSAGEAPHPSPSFDRYARALVARLTRNFPGARLGADLAFAGDLPQAAGLSSSSALTVGLASALVLISEIEERPEWKGAIRTLEDRAGYFACLENGADFGRLAGGQGVGALTGSEDQTAILACRAGTLSQYSFLPVRHRGDVALPPGWTFVVATSGVVAEKAGNARERYNRAALDVAALLEIWNGERDRRGEAPHASLAAALEAHPDAEPGLRELIRSRPDAPALERRLTHFVHEDRRVPEAARAFADADRGAISAISAESQRDAEELLGNQIPETSALVALARESGAFAASAFGGGFGGASWALIEISAAPAGEAFARRWLGAYRERFPQHVQAEAFVAPPSSGLLRIV